LNSASWRPSIATVKSIGQRPREQIAAAVRKRFPGRGFDRPRTSFHLAYQHRALNRGDAELSRPILVSVRNQPTLCISQMKKARGLFFTISKRWLRSCRVSSPLSVTPLPTVPNGQLLVMRNFFIDGLRQRYPDVHLRSLEEMLGDEGWLQASARRNAHWERGARRHGGQVSARSRTNLI